jgi:hypothetical protein
MPRGAILREGLMSQSKHDWLIATAFLLATLLPLVMATILAAVTGSI